MKRLITAAFVILSIANACSRDLAIVDTGIFPRSDGREVSFSWRMESSGSNVLQSAYRIVVASSRRGADSGENPVWDSGKVNSGESVHIPYGGPALDYESVYFWKVTVWTEDGRTASSGVSGWHTGVGVWNAEWIGLDGGIRIDEKGRTSLPARYLRKEFKVDGKVGNAVLYVCGLGSSECYVNGKRIGDDVFGPLPSWYPAAVNYLAYDVTQQIRKGGNAIGVILGNGRFMGMRNGKNMSFGVPRLIARLRIEYADGRTENISSDSSWYVTGDGPITANNEFDGEYYDARKELGRWSEADYSMRDEWRPADILDAPGGVLRMQTSPCMKIQDRLSPRSVRRTADGRIILDMGQNMVGWLAVRLKGRAGSPIRMRFSELLEKGCPDSLYMDNLRSALVTDEYIPARDGEFEWHPAFVYHGFRFVEISGLDYTPAESDFTGEVLYDAMPTTGSFETSDEILNAIHNNAYWGIRGNYRGMPTDCPQRDERMGWLGDRATGCYGESLIFGNERLYEKWMADIEESMSAEGCISVVSPRYWTKYNGDVTWPSAFIYGLDMLYRRFGNVQAVRDRYAAAKKWVNFILDNSVEDDIVVKDRYGDWCLPPESEELIHSKDPARITEGAVLSTSVFYDLLGRMQKFAVIAGCPEDAGWYAERAAVIKDSYNRHFFNSEEGSYGNNTVTANILSLRLGLVPDGFGKKVTDNIVGRTENEWNGHVSGGVLGIQHLMRGLTENGNVNLAYRIASSDTYPSWGYMVRKGATTIWELWNGDTADPAMNSGNHVMLLGDLIIWFYEYLGGIKCDEGSVAYKKIRLEPSLPDGLDFVKASYDSPYGRIVSNWNKSEGVFRWHVEIPANTTALVCLPDGSSENVGSGVYEYSVNL